MASISDPQRQLGSLEGVAGSSAPQVVESRKTRVVRRTPIRPSPGTIAATPSHHQRTSPACFLGFLNHQPRCDSSHAPAPSLSWRTQPKARLDIEPCSFVFTSRSCPATNSLLLFRHPLGRPQLTLFRSARGLASLLRVEAHEVSHSTARASRNDDTSVG